jgi:hypothetical protein
LSISMACVYKEDGKPCEWTSGLQMNKQIAGSLSSWHVYEEHREVWISVIGSDRPPRDPDPRKPEIMSQLRTLGTGS